MKVHRSRQQKEPMIPSEVIEGPWKHVAQDLFDCVGHKWLICVDYSEFFEIEKLKQDSTSRTVTEKTQKMLIVDGIPNVVITDNGPPFNGHEYEAFVDTYRFKHVTSSPTFAQFKWQCRESSRYCQENSDEVSRVRKRLFHCIIKSQKYSTR